LTFCLLTYFTAIAGNDPFTTEAALASVSEGDDTPFQMPLPEMRKTRTAVKAEDPVKFEDMCEVIGSVSVVLAYLFHRDMQALIPSQPRQLRLPRQRNHCARYRLQCGRPRSNEWI
jgi:hypothetical protein